MKVFVLGGIGMKNPCCLCIVCSMCEKSCEEFRNYFYSHRHIYDRASEIVQDFPTTYIEIADHMKRDFGRDYVWYAPIFDLREYAVGERII